MEKQPIMTLNDIKDIPREFLLLREIAPVIGCDPQTIRTQAHADPTKLGFPVIVTGSRIKVPKMGFIKFMRGELTE